MIRPVKSLDKFGTDCTTISQHRPTHLGVGGVALEQKQHPSLEEFVLELGGRFRVRKYVRSPLHGYPSRMKQVSTKKGRQQ